MTSSLTFSGYAALLRDFIRAHSTPARLLSERRSVHPLLGERAGVVRGKPEECSVPMSLDPPSNLENGFNHLALSLFTLQFTHNPPYRRFCEARRVAPDTIEHWSGIPAIPAAAFKEFELTSLPADRRARVFHSSGTTGQRPGRHFHDAESLSLYEASLLPWFQTHLLPEFPPADPKTEIFHPCASLKQAEDSSPSPGGPRCAERTSHIGQLTRGGLGKPLGRGEGGQLFDHSSAPRFLSLTPLPELAPHSSLVHMFATIHRQFGSPDAAFTGLVQADGAWEVDIARSLAILSDAIAAGLPVAVMGTAFNFVQLADSLENSGLRPQLPAGSRVLETGGYKGRTRSLAKPDLHALITKLLGIPPGRIVSEYGMSELSSQAYDQVIPPTPGSSVDSTPLPSSDEGRGQGERMSERVFHLPPWARAQIVSPETGREVAEGETGLIRVFDLANLRSVLAIQTGDIGIRRGDAFELLGRTAQAEPRGCSLMSA
jgi:hypothetical protein